MGPQEGADAELLVQLKTDIVARFDPEGSDIRGATLAARLPYRVLGDRDLLFRDAIWQKLTASPAFAAQLGPSLIAVAEMGDAAMLGGLLQAATQAGHDTQAQANVIDQETGTFPLLMAAQNGHTEAVALLLDHGAEPNTKNPENGSFPLLMAAQNGHTEAVALLLQQGAEPNTVDPVDGGFPLLLAAQEGHAEAVALLLQHGAEPNTVDPVDGGFPLLMAAQNGHAEAVALLLEQGAEPNATHAKTGLFPLLMAAQEGHTEAVALLLEQGADIEARHIKSNVTALVFAVANRRRDVVRLLMERPASTETLPEDLRSLLDLLLSDEALPELDAPQSDAPDAQHEAQSRQKQPPIPGNWETEEVTTDHGAQIDKMIRDADLPADRFAGIVSLEHWQDALGQGKDLRYLTFAMRQAPNLFFLSLLWLHTNDRTPPVLLYPGLDLDALATGLRDHNIALDLRRDQHRKTFAALVAALFDPPVYPLPQTDDLPLLGATDALRSAIPEETWRAWRSFKGPQGPVVELPVMVNDAVHRMTVTVPDDGIGARIQTTKLITPTAPGWTNPRWNQNENGRSAKFKFVTSTEENAE